MAASGPRFFLSYRRGDSAGHAGRLADHLLDRFGAGSVFMDVESIEAGADFMQAVDRAICDSDAVLVLIGPGWLDATASDGRRRLENTGDFVRMEIEAALRSDTRVIPVLVGGARMPAEDQLPDAIAALASRNAVELQDRRWREDVDALVDVLEGRGKAVAGNLPVQPTPFLGRARELAEVIELLRRDDTRLLTLTGPGGIGKSRLAVQAASKLVHTYPGGAWFVELATHRDPDLIAPTVATMLDLREGPGSSIQETLVRHLRRRRLLLVLDNMEQLLPDAASLLGELVAEAPGLDLLVSSREPLAVRAERRYPVGELMIDDAVGLFADRAEAAAPGFELEETSRSVVETICRRLDAMPLAIELAAARVKILSPTELVGRLEDRLPILVGGARDAPERQRTMHATIAWSYDLLEDHERILFARLAVFRGGCGLEAAEEVCGADLETMGSLVDKSLLRTEERPAGRTRYLSLETIREFASERIAERPEADDVRRRHAEYVVGLAKQALPGLKGKDQDAWLERLEAEHDNVRAALRWSLDEGDPSGALELASLAWEFWLMHGDVSEGRAWLAESLERADPVATDARALALAGTGWLAAEQGEWTALSSEFLEESLRCADAASPATRAYLFAFLGEVLTEDPERARSFCEGAVALARESGDRWVLAITLNSLAQVSLAAGDRQRASALYQQELDVSREIGDRFNEALCLANLGEMAFMSGELRRARELFAEASDLAEERGDRRHRSFALLGLGWIALCEDRFDEAERCFHDSLVLEREVGSHIATVSAFTGLAGVAAAEGRDARASTLVGIAEALQERMWMPPDLSDAGAHEAHLAASRARAGERWDEYRSEGGAMELDAAIDYALG